MSQESTENIEKENINEENVSETQGIPTPELSLEEQLQRLKHNNMVLQQENDFLKRVRFINKKQIVKQSKNKQ